MCKDDIRCHLTKQEPWENGERNKVIFCENDGWGWWEPCINEDAGKDQGQEHILENWSLLEPLLLTHLRNWINTKESQIRYKILNEIAHSSYHTGRCVTRKNTTIPHTNRSAPVVPLGKIEVVQARHEISSTGTCHEATPIKQFAMFKQSLLC